MTSSAPPSSKPAVLLLCGLLCDAAIWQPQRVALRDLADVQVMDFAGFDSIAQMAAHVLDVAPPHFALAGHSMGGRVALEIMRQAPARVLRLALLDTGIAPRRRTRRAACIGATGACPGNAGAGSALVAADAAPRSPRRWRVDGWLDGHGATAKRAKFCWADQCPAGTPRCGTGARAHHMPDVVGSRATGRVEPIGAASGHGTTHSAGAAGDFRTLRAHGAGGGTCRRQRRAARLVAGRVMARPPNAWDYGATAAETRSSPGVEIALVTP